MVLTREVAIPQSIIVSMLASMARAVVMEWGEPNCLRGGASWICGSGKGRGSGDTEHDEGM
jgi:hypothetical protein